MRKTALLIGLLAGSFILPGQLIAEKVEGLILKNENGVLRVLDVVSYDKFLIPVTDSTIIVRKNHKGITVDDLRVGWFVEVEGNTVKVKTGRFEEVRFDGFQEHGDVPDILIVDGQSVSLKESRVVRKKYFPGDLKAGMKTEVLGIRQENGTVKAKEVLVEPNETGILERDSLREVAKFVRQMDRKPQVIKNSQVQRYVERVGERLIPGSVKGVTDFRFYVIDNPSINAFASRSAGSSKIRGSVYVTTGMLQILENEAQLASVLGHEIAHITHEHLSRGAVKKMWTDIALSVAGAVIGQTMDGAGEIFAGIGLGLAGSALINGYGRNFEDQADRVGLRYMYDAGYDPMQAPRVWHVITQHTRDMDKVTNFFYGSHSTHIARKRNLFREISQTYFDFVNQGLSVNEDAFRENAKRHVSSGDKIGLYDFESTVSATPALPTYSGTLFVPWRTKSHRRHSEQGYLRASDKFLIYLQSKDVNLVDDDFHQRAFHQDRRFRRLASTTEDTETLLMSSIISTARSLGADSVLLLQVSRPVTQWIKLEAQCYDLDGNVLWEEAVGYGNAVWPVSGRGAPEKTLRKLTKALEKRLGSDCLN